MYFKHDTCKSLETTLRLNWQSKRGSGIEREGRLEIRVKESFRRGADGEESMGKEKKKKGL